MHVLRATLFGVLATLGFAGPVWAASPCGAGFDHPLVLDLSAVLQPGAAAGAGPVRHLWGRSNMQLLSEDGETVLRVAYPEGSVDPGDAAAPVGGGGFIYPAPGQAQARCLAYRLRFPEGFDFVKGGKLPGLYGGQAPRGCAAADLAAGFSARLMWRSGGAGELYLYAPGRKLRCGESVGRGSFRFTPGRWTQIAEEVAVNTPGQSDGSIRVWVDGQLVIERTDLDVREQPQTGVDGLLFSTFFGGSDPSWASPRDQSAEFGGFTIWDGRP